MKVSKREAFLLFILAFVGIVGMMLAFVVFPLMNEVNENKMVLDDLRNQKLIIDTSIPNEANLRKQLDEKLLEVSNTLQTFESPINEAQFERWVLPLTTKYDMRVTSTSFSEYTPSAPVAIDTVHTDVYYSIKDLVDRYHSVDTAEDSIPESSSLVAFTKHTYTATTTYARYVYFLDEVTSWDTSIFINESSYDFAESQAIYTFDLYTTEQLLSNEVEKDYINDITAGGTGMGDANENPHPEGGK